MDKKRPNRDSDDLKGFEEFIEGQPSGSFLPKGVGGNKKNESGFEHFTFLTNDSQRLTKLNNLLNEKLPFSARFDQGDKLVKEQREELESTKKKLFEICEQKDSPYQKSMAEIFDSFFGP